MRRRDFLSIIAGLAARPYSWHGIAIFALFVVVMAAAGWANVARAQQQFIGVPSIHDGDTVKIGGTKIRLYGIDAPETSQYCLDNNGQRADCGKAVRDRLIEKSAGRSWTCSVLDYDHRYKRPVASCRVGDDDIQKWMVRSGLALAYKQYSHQYDADEEVAREARAGLWSGAFIAPWDWRHRNRSTKILGAVSVPIGAQKILLPKGVEQIATQSASKSTTTAVHNSMTPTTMPTAAQTTHRSGRKHGRCQNPDDRAADGSRCGKRAASVKKRK